MKRLFCLHGQRRFVLAAVMLLAAVFDPGLSQAAQIGPVLPGDPDPQCQICRQNCDLQSDLCASPCNTSNSNCEVGCGGNPGCRFNCAVAFEQCVRQCSAQRGKCWQVCPCLGAKP